MRAGKLLAAMLSSLMSLGLGGCAEAPKPVALDLAAIKVPAVRASTLTELRSRPAPPKLPADRRATADWIDRLRLDIEQKAAVGWELVEGVNQCRAPLRKLARGG